MSQPTLVEPTPTNVDPIRIAPSTLEQTPPDVEHPPTKARAPWQRTLELSLTLGITDWKMRFYGSILGYVWSLVRPFAFFGVVYVVFTQIMDLGNNVKHYGVYILFGLVLFSFFAELTNTCLTSLPARENLLRKIQFPRIVIPLSVTITSLLHLCTTLIAVLIFALLSGVEPQVRWLELIPLIGLLTMFATGVGMVLSIIYVRYRDIQPIWEVVTQALFYASPVLYVASIAKDRFTNLFDIYMLNPIAFVMTEIRHAVVDTSVPGPLGLAGYIALIPVGICFACAVLGGWIFINRSKYIAEKL
jgi:ABC-2 type transport system permease protein